VSQIPLKTASPLAVVNDIKHCLWKHCYIQFVNFFVIELLKWMCVINELIKGNKMSLFMRQVNISMS